MNDNFDFKGTLEKFIKADEPKMSQEETIDKYQEFKKIKKSTTGNNDESESVSEEEEHLKRIKKELLASLERVKKLEKKVFEDESISEKARNRLKVKNDSQAGSNKSLQKDNRVEQEFTQVSDNNQKERE